MSPKVVRQIVYFDKKTEMLSGEIPLPAVDLAILQQIFGLPKDDLMYEEHLICEATRQRLEQLSRSKFNMDKYDYFLSCYGED